MENLQLSTQLVNAILQYLGTRPYLESVNLINGIQKEVEAQVKSAQPAEVTAG